MTKKEKQRRNQKRQMKQGQKKKQRTKRVLHQKHTVKKEKTTTKKVSTVKDLPLKVRIKIYYNDVIRKILRLGCFIGFHDWKLCAGKEGDPKYTCIRCWKRSKKVWEKRGSAEYYDRKHEDKMGISNPENWDEVDGKWYFKGRYIQLNKESLRRLRVILKKKNEPEKK